MRGADHAVAPVRVVDSPAFRNRRRAPEQEDEALLALVECVDDGVRETLPSFVRVAVRLPGAAPHGERRVQQQHTCDKEEGGISESRWFARAPPSTSTTSRAARTASSPALIGNLQVGQISL